MLPYERRHWVTACDDSLHLSWQLGGDLQHHVVWKHVHHGFVLGSCQLVSPIEQLLETKELLVVESRPSLSDHVQMRVRMERGLVESPLANVIALMQSSVKKIRLCIAAAYQLILEPGVEVDQVPGVLSRVEHHL